jgi:predicted helicase
MSEKKLAKVFYSDLWGLRKDKYKCLFENDVQTTKWQEIEPVSPYHFFVPKDFALQAEYERFWKVTEIFKSFQIGLMTGQDEFFIDSNPQALKARILAIFNKNLNDETLKNLYNLKSQAGEKTIKARNSTIFKQELICLYCYRPFDIRYVYAENKFLWRSVEELKKHFIFNNIALVTTRILAKLPFNHVFVSRYPGDNTLISSQTKERNYFFPLYLYPDEPVGVIHELPLQDKSKSTRNPNFTSEFLQAIKVSLGIEPTSEEIFYYIYAVLYSPTYRKRYEEFLKIDFPRVPLPQNNQVFEKLSNLGKELVELHLLKHPDLENTEVGFPKSGSNKVEKVGYDEEGQRVFINKEQYFDGISKVVWKYRIGAYQVMEKYLKDRKGRKLSLDEINHYMKVAKAIQLTIELQEKIDIIFKNSQGC